MEQSDNKPAYQIVFDYYLKNAVEATKGTTIPADRAGKLDACEEIIPMLYIPSGEIPKMIQELGKFVEENSLKDAPNIRGWQAGQSVRNSVDRLITSLADLS